ncbi:MAG: iron hydrogenase [Patescibacteria group bacterium]
MLISETKPNSRAISIVGVMDLIYFGTLSGLAIMMPFFPFQGLTGPIVNAIILIAVVILGLRRALLICILPSMVALSSGLLPFVLAPMIPFIILGNMLLAIVFEKLYKQNFWSAVGVGALAKFGFIFVAGQIVIKFFINQTVSSKILALISWPQFLTALGGGVIAFVFLKTIKKI